MRLDDCSGKKLLILGATGSEKEIINAARSMGVYTITTDNHLNWDDAPAKKISDEAWDISWSDIDALKDKCEAGGVDGVMAGFSDKRVVCARKLSEALGKPFYADNADLECVFDKLRFKDACRAAGIRVPRTFGIDERPEFPVIVKPADNGGSRGITICYTEEELKLAIQKAAAFSESQEIVIEEYLTGDEIMVYFTVHGGEATVSAMCDRYMHLFDANITQLPVGYYYPSKHLKSFMDYNLEKYQKLIEVLNIRDGLIAFQSFVIGKDVIPFDPTFRLDGTMTYRITEKRNGANCLKMMINKSLAGSMGDDREIRHAENPVFEKPAFELPILLGKGIIGTVEGLETVRDMPDVIFVNERCGPGARMEAIADFSQIFCRIHICAESNEKIEEDISEIYSAIKVTDEEGNDMIIGRDTFCVGA